MARPLIVALVLACCAAPDLPAQLVPAVPPVQAATPPILREHADGGELPLLALGGSLAGLVVYDIATAPAAARRHNELSPAAAPRSPRTALLLSAAATALPVGLGILAIDRGSGEGNGAELLGVGLIGAGLTAGPGAGHWYAGRRRTAARNAAVRAALLLGAFYVESCCT